MQEKKIPLRMCNGCGKMKPKQELVRIVKNAANEISLDLNGKSSGRGAYICKNAECLKRARKSRRIDRTFSSKIPDEVYDTLEEALLKNE